MAHIPRRRGRLLPVIGYEVVNALRRACWIHGHQTAPQNYFKKNKNQDTNISVPFFTASPFLSPCLLKELRFLSFTQFPFDPFLPSSLGKRIDTLSIPLGVAERLDRAFAMETVTRQRGSGRSHCRPCFLSPVTAAHSSKAQYGDHCLFVPVGVMG